MPQSLSKVYIHAIFSTKDREAAIPKSALGDFHADIAGILTSMGSPSIRVGGTSDHLHALFCLGRATTISDAIRTVKIRSNQWMKERLGCMFAWQRGYAAFSVSQSKVDAVKKYIENQEEHHRKATFQEEYIQFLEAYGEKYDIRYVWD